MKLHLIRHAKALQAVSNENDFDRALAEHGKKQAAALGNYLKEKNVACEVWCSDAKRTVETLQVLEEHNKFKSTTFFNEFYLCPKEFFLEKLWTSSSTEDVIIVAHNFGISDLANYFLDDVIEMRTCEYICIEFSTDKRNETSRDAGIIIDRWKFA